MSSIKKKFGIFGSLLLILALVVMALPTTSLATTYPTTLTDDLGREITIGALPVKIVSLAPSNTEILFALGLEDRVVGVTEFCDYPPEALEKETIGGPWTPSIESIVALEPDLVLAEEINPIDTITTLEGLGVTVFGIEATDLEDLLNDINTVGQITDKEAEAAALTADMQSTINTVTGKTAGLSPEEKPGVFYILWHDPPWTAGEGTFPHDLIERAGGINIFADVEGWTSVSLETLIARDPEVIIVTAMGGTGSTTWDWVNTELLLADVSARQNGRIHFVESNWVERPGPRVVLGLAELAKLIQPDLFSVIGGGGGGGGGGRKYIHGNIFGKESHFRISLNGEVEKAIEVTPEDGRLTMTIPEGTIAKGEDGKRLKSLEITTNENPPPPPEDAHIIGSPYSFGPAGANFDPPITVEFTYDPDTIPEGVNEEDLVLACYDEDTGEWIELECTVNPATHTITACMAHFTTFAIIGSEEEEPPSEPAAFTFSSLAISPNEVDVGENVSITVMIANTGGELGSYEATLKINGEVEATEEVNIAAGSSQQVSFITPKDTAGTYIVDIGGLTDSFVVKAAPPVVPPIAPPVVSPIVPPAVTPIAPPVVSPIAPPVVSPIVPPAVTPAKPINWWLTGGIIAAVITAIAVPLTIRRRRRA